MVTVRSIRMVYRSYCEIQIKLIEHTLNRDLYDLGGQQIILKQDMKSTNQKEMIVKLNYIKIRNSCSLKGHQDSEKAVQSGGSCLQYLELVNDLYPKYVMSS